MQSFIPHIVSVSKDSDFKLTFKRKYLVYPAIPSERCFLVQLEILYD